MGKLPEISEFVRRARPPLLDVDLSNQIRFAWDRGSQSLAACPHPAALGRVAPAFEKANLAAARSYLP